MPRIEGWSYGRHFATYISDDCETSVKNELLASYGLKILHISKDLISVIHENEEKEFEINDEEFEGIYSGDVLSISENGHCSVVYSCDSGEIDFFMTNKCNSNCVMCPLPEATRRKPQTSDYINWLNEYIDVLPRTVEYVNITGGEPTFFQKDFLYLLEKMNNKFDVAEFQLLSNGRSFADRDFLDEVLKVSPEGLRFAIPIHASDQLLHDSITRSKNSFKQTDIGIKNLLARKQKVEVRIVISQKNKGTLKETAKYIVANYKGAFCVTFIGMEMMGNAALNRDELWLDYNEAFRSAKEAIDHLVRAGIDVELYNFPLCSVDHGYWHIAAKSITDYKVRYMEECEECEVMDICGGFFSSTQKLMSPKVYPIKKRHED